MEELFDIGQGGPERADISLCIFPHLREFLVFDLRRDEPRATLLSATEVFDEPFLDKLEQGFREIARQPTEHPFAHFMDLPLRVEELVREVGMLTILDRLGDGWVEGEFPTVAVYIITGAALTMTPQQISVTLRSMLGNGAGASILSQCSEMLERLIGEEHDVAKRSERHELRQALEDQSPSFFTLWERRN